MNIKAERKHVFMSLVLALFVGVFWMLFHEYRTIVSAPRTKSNSLGQKIFLDRCANCHGDHGQGMTGPNLTDDYWVDGDGSLTDVMATIANGHAKRGMPAFKNLLNSDELSLVSSYVISLQGTHPILAKPPEGTKVQAH